LVQIKCTRKLVRRIGAKPAGGESNPSTVLGDWHANIIPVWGGEIIISLNERSLLTVILPAAAVEDLGAELRYRAFSLIERLNLPARFAEAVEAEFESVVITKADNRTLLGRLNQVARYAEGKIDLKHMERTQREAEDFLTRWLHGPPPFRRPMDVLHEVIRSAKT
jgi:hypothetical protein